MFTGGGGGTPSPRVPEPPSHLPAARRHSPCWGAPLPALQSDRGLPGPLGSCGAPFLPAPPWPFLPFRRFPGPSSGGDEESTSAAAPRSVAAARRDSLISSAAAPCEASRSSGSPGLSRRRRRSDRQGARRGRQEKFCLCAAAAPRLPAARGSPSQLPCALGPLRPGFHPFCRRRGREFLAGLFPFFFFFRGSERRRKEGRKEGGIPLCPPQAPTRKPLAGTGGA